MEGWLLPPPTTGPGSAEPRPQPQLTSKEPLVFLQRLAQASWQQWAGLGVRGFICADAVLERRGLCHVLHAPLPCNTQMDRLHAIPASLKSKWDKKFLDLLYTVITDKKVDWCSWPFFWWSACSSFLHAACRVLLDTKGQLASALCGPARQVGSMLGSAPPA